MLRRVNSFSRHFGKSKQKFTFELSHIEIESGTPSFRSAPSLAIQCGRGSKTTTSKEVETPQSESGGLSFAGQTLSFRATLFAGKETGYSEKLYRVAVLAVKPDFGTTKPVYQEVAAADLDVANFAQSKEPCKVQLICRGERRNKIVLDFYICARPATAGDDDDDDDETEPARGGSGVSLKGSPESRPEPPADGVGRETSTYREYDQIPTPVRSNFQRTKRAPEATAPAMEALSPPPPWSPLSQGTPAPVPTASPAPVANGKAVKELKSEELKSEELKKALAAAVADEDYVAAAELKKAIKAAEEAEKVSVAAMTAATEAEAARMALMTSAVDAAKAEAAAATKKVRALEESQASLQSELREARQQLKRQAATMAMARGQEDDKEDERRAREDARRAEIAELQDELANLRGEIGERQEELTSACDRIASLEEELTKSLSDLKKAHEEIREIRAQGGPGALEDALVEAKMQAAQYAMELEDLKHQLKGLKPAAQNTPQSKTASKAEVHTAQGQSSKQAPKWFGSTAAQSKETARKPQAAAPKESDLEGRSGSEEGSGSEDSEGSEKVDRPFPTHAAPGQDAARALAHRALENAYAEARSPRKELKGVSPAQEGRPRQPTAAEKLVKSNEAFYEELLEIPGNHVCADCGSSEELKWASSNLGVILCTECVGAHRSLGVHISAPLSLTLDDWTDKQRRHMLSLGNMEVNAVYEAHEAAAQYKPKPDDALEVKVAWVKSKYAAGSFKEDGDGLLGQPRQTSKRFSHKGQTHSGVAFVKVISAEALPNMDNSSGLGIDKSDPYCRLLSGSVMRQTKVIEDTLNPVWNETLPLNIDDLRKPIKLTVWDRDLTSADDLMGDARIWPAELEPNEPTRMVIPLNNVPEWHKEQATVTVEVTWAPLDDDSR